MKSQNILDIWVFIQEQQEQAPAKNKCKSVIDVGSSLGIRATSRMGIHISDSSTQPLWQNQNSDLTFPL